MNEIGQPSTGIELLRRMKRIRAVEEMIASRYPEGKMRCPVHLSTGQEAVAAATGLALDREDQVVSTHRSHAHYLGKGGDLCAMMAEIYGKATGCSGGRGGSMHLTDQSVGFVASTAIVGNSLPIGVGLGLANRLLGNGRVSCVFLGDAAPEEGVFYEALNFAALKKLPVLFVCENNLYSVYTHLKSRQPEGRKIWQVAGALGLDSGAGDGNDAWAAYQQIRDALVRVRAGNGPAFLEFSTYRWREHCGPFLDNDLGYRSMSEFLEWKERDPVAMLTTRLLNQFALRQEDLLRMDEDVVREAKEAFVFAEQAPEGTPEDARTFLFADQG